MINTVLLVLALAQLDCAEPVPVVLGDARRVALDSEVLRVPAEASREKPGEIAALESCAPGVQSGLEGMPLLGPMDPTWLRFRLTTIGSRNSDWLLRIPARGLPSVCVYWPRRNGFERRCEGRGRETSYGAWYVFELPAELDFQGPVLLELSGGLVAPRPLDLVRRQFHERQQRNELLGTGLLLGLTLAVVTLCWIAFLSLRERAYLWFSGFILCWLLGLAGFLGRGLQFAGTYTGWLATSGPTVFCALGLALMVLFCRAYLHLRHAPSSAWNGIGLAVIAVNALVILLAAVQPSGGLRLLPLAAFLTVLALAAMIGQAARTGSRRALYLAGSLGLLFLGVLLTSLGAGLDRTTLLMQGVPLLQAGTLVMPLVLMIGIHRQYRAMATQRDQARRALQAEQRLALLRTSYCRLTGLPLRGRVLELFARMTRGCDTELARIGVYLLHLDNLSEIRRRHGRAVLEQTVTELARRMREEMEDDQLLGRLDNGELVVIVPTTARREDFRTRLYEAAEHIALCVQRPMTVDGQQLSLSVSVGLAIWPLHGYAFDDLLRRCDSALYEAREEGGNRVKVFSEQDHAARSDQFRRVSDLRRALQAGELELFYQPQHAATDRRLVGVEALLRWRHPDLGLLLPAQFIPLAENSALIIDLGDWVLESAMLDLAWLRQQGCRELDMSFNVSPRQLVHGDFAAQLTHALGNKDIDPTRLHLEITEDSLIDSMDQTRAALEEIAALGIRIDVDDFGVGYSSLNYLRSLPVHGLKIDRSFVRNIGRTGQDEAVVAAIVRLAQNLRLDTVAEGVESARQLAFLQGLDCHLIQGHFFSEPLPRDRLLDYALARRVASAG